MNKIMINTKKKYHNLVASFIPTVPPSLPRLRLGKWLRKLMWIVSLEFVSLIGV